MKEKIEALRKNKTWQLIERPEGRNGIGCRWVYELKKDAKGNVERYKARLVINW